MPTPAAHGRVADLNTLVHAPRRSTIAQIGDGRERQAGNAPVERIGRHAVDAGGPDDVGVVGVEVAAPRAVAIVGNAQNVVEAAFGEHPGHRHVPAGRGRRTADRRKRRRVGRRRLAIADAGIEHTARRLRPSAPRAAESTWPTRPAAPATGHDPTPAAATCATLRLRTEDMRDAEVHVVAVRRVGRDVVEVLGVAENVGLRDEREERLRRRIDA